MRKKGNWKKNIGKKGNLEECKFGKNANLKKWKF